MEKKSKILITGAKGMLGSALCKELRNCYNIEYVDYGDFDVTDKLSVGEFFKEKSFDAVIHCAAYTQVDKAEDEKDKALLLNVQGTKNLTENIKNKDCLFVYISTDYVFDGKKESPYLETDKPNPLNSYGLSKLKGEEVVSSLKKHIIIRTSWLFGPNGKNFVDTVIKLANKKETIEIVNDQRGSPTYTFDLSSAIKSVLDIYFKDKIEYGIYNVTNSRACSWFEFANYIIKTAALEAAILPISSSKLVRKAKRPNNSVLSNVKFHKLTGYYLPSWQEGLDRYLKNYLIKKT